ncbi:MAG: hypothetical protein KF841_16620 [Phycisphaerae bacterium]|nr:hypothetical protein [Phycisphaerae bacterium]
MIRYYGLAICLSVLTLGGCTGEGVSLLCSNDLDGSLFGFSLTVPAPFTCSSVVANPTSLANVGYRDSATQRFASVQVNSPQNGEVQEGVASENLGNVTNSQGFEFDRKKVTIDGVGVSYVAGTVLSSGNILFITVSGSQDDPALQDALDAIIATVSESSSG